MVAARGPVDDPGGRVWPRTPPGLPNRAVPPLTSINQSQTLDPCRHDGSAFSVLYADNPLEIYARSVRVSGTASHSTNTPATPTPPTATAAAPSDAREVAAATSRGPPAVPMSLTSRHNPRN